MSDVPCPRCGRPLRFVERVERWPMQPDDYYFVCEVENEPYIWRGDPRDAYRDAEQVMLPMDPGKTVDLPSFDFPPPDDAPKS